MALLGRHGIPCIFTNPNSISHYLKIEPYTNYSLHAKILLPMDLALMLGFGNGFPFVTYICEIKPTM
jgi:hypothetical protein